MAFFLVCILQLTINTELVDDYVNNRLVTVDMINRFSLRTLTAVRSRFSLHSLPSFCGPVDSSEGLRGKYKPRALGRNWWLLKCLLRIKDLNELSVDWRHGREVSQQETSSRFSTHLIQKWSWKEAWCNSCLFVGNICLWAAV